MLEKGPSGRRIWVRGGKGAELGLGSEQKLCSARGGLGQTPRTQVAGGSRAREAGLRIWTPALGAL